MIVPETTVPVAALATAPLFVALGVAQQRVAGPDPRSEPVAGCCGMAQPAATTGPAGEEC